MKAAATPPALARPPIAGSETFGVPVRPATTKTRSGKASIDSLADVEALALRAGDLLVVPHPLHPYAVHVRQAREGIHEPDPGEGEPFAVLVVDVFARDGAVLTFGAGELLRVAVRGEVIS